MDARQTFVVDYKLRKFHYSTTVKHLGQVVVFALDENRAIHYVVLDTDQRTALPADGAVPSAAAGVEAEPALDAQLWPATPSLLTFPRELARAGFGSLPNLSLQAPAASPDGDLLDRATTARLTALARFQVVSAGEFLYLFRQSLWDAADPDMQLAPGSAAGPAIASGTLLVDRFVLVGSALLNKNEVRFRRSRHKHVPANKTDSLGPDDMEGTVFREPTLALGFVHDLAQGGFDVLLLETQVPTIERWLIFACNRRGGIDWYSVERSADGLFNTRGTQFYTSSDPGHRDVFESEPGPDPFVPGMPLVAIVDADGRAGRSLDLGLLPAGATPAVPIDLGTAGWTLEAWFSWPMPDGHHALAAGAAGARHVTLAVHEGSMCVFTGDEPFNGFPNMTPADGWHHMAVVAETQLSGYPAGTGGASLYLNGRLQVRGAVTGLQPVSTPITLIGNAHDGSAPFRGRVGEIRVWNLPRGEAAILSGHRQRLLGDEPGLVGYWRCDEGSGDSAHDLTNRHNNWKLSAATGWAVGGAPVGDNPGVSRGRFEFQGRRLASGLSAVRYAQKEEAPAGYGQQPKPQQRAVRVMLAVAVSSASGPRNEVAIVDMAVNREGKISEPTAVIDLGAHQLPAPPDPTEASLFAATQRAVAAVAANAAMERRLAELDARLLGFDRGSITASFGHAEGFRPAVTVADGWTLYVPADPAFTADVWDRERRTYRQRGTVYVPRVAVLAQALVAGDQLQVIRQFSQRWHPHADRNEFNGGVTFFDQVDVFGADGVKKTSGYIDARVTVGYGPDYLGACRAEQTALRRTVAEHRQQLERARAGVTDKTRVPMRLLRTGGDGLTVSCGVLAFAYTDTTPRLFESASGRVALYFKGADGNGQFFAAYFDTLNQRAVRALRGVAGGADTPADVLFVARSCERELDWAAVQVSGDDAQVCDVGIDQFDGPPGQRSPAARSRERWPRVSRQPGQFCATLNGDYRKPVFVGNAECSDAGGTRMALVAKDAQWLLAGTPLELGAGSLLLLGGQRCLAKSVIQAGEQLVIELDVDAGRKPLAPNLRPLRIGDAVEPGVATSALFTDTWDTLRLQAPLAGAIFPGTLLQVGDIRVTTRLLARTGSREIDFLPIDASVFANELLGLRQRDVAAKVAIVSADGAAYREVGSLDIAADAAAQAVLSRTANGCVFRLPAALREQILDKSRGDRSVRVHCGSLVVAASGDAVVALDRSTPQLHDPAAWNTPVAMPVEPDPTQLLYVVRFDPQLLPAAANAGPGQQGCVAVITGVFAVQRLLYDYDAATISSDGRSGAVAAGSHLFTVQPGPSGQAVRNGDTDMGPTPAGAWVAAAPGTTLRFDSSGQSAAGVGADAGADALHRFEAGDAMTLECWARPESVPGPARLVHYRNGAGHFGYTLGLLPAAQQSAVVLHRDESLRGDLNCDIASAAAKAGDTIELWFQTRLRDCTLASLYASSNKEDWYGHGGGLSAQATVVRSVQLFGGPGSLRGIVAKWFDPVSKAGGSLQAPGEFADGAWHHVALVSHAEGMRLYVDGALAADIAALAPAATAGRLAGKLAFHAGAATPQGNLPAGGDTATLALDAVRIWKVARDAPAIARDRLKRLPQGTPGLLACWHFELQPTPYFNDYSGRGNAAFVLFSRDRGWRMVKPVVNATSPAFAGYTWFAGVRYKTDDVHWTTRFFASTQPLPCGAWHHLAATPRIAFGVSLGGADHVDCGHGPSLNLGESFALEVFLRTTDFKQPQGLMCKGGRPRDGQEPASIAYELTLRKDDGCVIFAFSDRNGQRHQVVSTKGLPPNTYCKVSVLRSRSRATDDSDKQNVHLVVTDICSIVSAWLDGGVWKSETTTFPPDTKAIDPAENDEVLEIGRAYDGGAASYFRGFIAEARVWMTAINPIDAGAAIGGREKLLAARWTFDARSGRSVPDLKGPSHATLHLADPSRNPWRPNPDPSASSIVLHVDGTPVHAVEVAGAPPSFGTHDEFRIGALGLQVNGLTECLVGELAELRIWGVARTRAQLLNNLFTRLHGGTDDLVAGYTFDFPVGALLADQGPRQNHLRLASPPTATMFRLSTAPIGDDTPQVRSALARVKTLFNDRIDSSPDVEEYAAIERDSRGRPVGVMKRCYTFIQDGVWRIISGFKIGNLQLEWVGQVQSRPTLIGYIEGAPPVPSENLTSTGLKLGEYADYSGASSVELVEASAVTYSYSTATSSASRNVFEWLMAARVDVEFHTGVAALIASFGKVAAIEAEVGPRGTVERAEGQSLEGEAQVSRTHRKVSTLGLRGAWELTPLNASIGRRWVPHNSGMAVVQSESLDLYALRLAHNHAIVGYRLLPNPDIPKDWSLIEFPINPAYTKQGTLDGKIGCRPDGSVQLDADYPAAAEYGEWSYFKPHEAYALKRGIERDRTRLASDHERLSVAARAGDTEGTGSGAQAAQRLKASRNMANTYVWTAAGGFFAESTDVLDAVSESSSGSYTVEKMFGYTYDITATALAGVHTAIDDLYGQHVETVKTKASSSENSFALDVQVNVEPDLQLYVNTPEEAERYKNAVLEGSAAFDAHGKVVKRPGKVDAYRFMSFYLEPDHRHTQDFFNKVVDPIWLAQGTAANAVALRQARGDAKARPWRVLHRVTFVSRILPDFAPRHTGAPSTLAQALRAEDIESNWGLLQALGPFVQGKTSDDRQFRTAVHQTLVDYFPLLVPYERELLQIARLYFDVPLSDAQAEMA